MPRSHYFWSVLVILAVALVVRCAGAVWWQARLDQRGQQFAFGDSESYWVLAHQIASGGPYQYGSAQAQIFRVPLYPMLISTLVSTQDRSAGVLKVRILGCFLGTLAVAGIMVLAHQIFSTPRVTLTAGTLAALYPGAISMSVFILSEAPFCPLMLGNLLAWRQASVSERRASAAAWSLGAGVLSGLAVLARPSWLLFAPFACVFDLLRGKPSRTLIMFVMMSLGLAATMTPWWIRNYRITGHFVLTTLQVGPSMYDGLHSGATGASDTGMQFMDRFVAEQQRADSQSEALDSTFEYRVNQRASQAAGRWAKEHPGEVLRLAMIKVMRTWRPWSVAEQTGGLLLGVVAAGGMFVIVVPAIIGTVRRVGAPRDLMLLWMPALYFTCLHAVFIGSMRYRLPGVLILTVIAAPVWVKFARRMMHRNSDADPVATATPPVKRSEES